MFVAKVALGTRAPVLRTRNFLSDGSDLRTCGVMLVSQNGSPPLLAAVKGSHDSIVKGLLAVSANVNAAANVKSFSPRPQFLCGSASIV